MFQEGSLLPLVTILSNENAKFASYKLTMTYIFLNYKRLAPVFPKNFRALIESDMARQVQIIFKPSSSLELQVFQLLLAGGPEQVAEAVLGVHELIDLAFVILLQIW